MFSFSLTEAATGNFTVEMAPVTHMVPTTHSPTSQTGGNIVGHGHNIHVEIDSENFIIYILRSG